MDIRDIDPRTPKQKIAQRANAALMDRLHATLSAWNKAEARRKKRAHERIPTTHPKQRRAMAIEALRRLFLSRTVFPVDGVLVPVEVYAASMAPAMVETPEDWAPAPHDPGNCEGCEEERENPPGGPDLAISPSDAPLDVPEKDPA